METFLKPVVAVSIGTNSGNDALNKTKKLREAPFFHDFCIVTSKNMKTNNKNGREASENFENGVFSSLHFYYHRFKFTTTDFSPKTATTTDLYYHGFKTLNHTLLH